MQMHIYHVNKPITIDINCLMEMEGKEGRGERTCHCGMETINCPWLWLCPPFTCLTLADQYSVLADYSGNTPRCTEVCASSWSIASLRGSCLCLWLYKRTQRDYNKSLWSQLQEKWTSNRYLNMFLMFKEWCCHVSVSMMCSLKHYGCRIIYQHHIAEMWGFIRTGLAVNKGRNINNKTLKVLGCFSCTSSGLP